MWRKALQIASLLLLAAAGTFLILRRIEWEREPAEWIDGARIAGVGAGETSDLDFPYPRQVTPPVWSGVKTSPGGGRGYSIRFQVPKELTDETVTLYERFLQARGFVLRRRQESTLGLRTRTVLVAMRGKEALEVEVGRFNGRVAIGYRSDGG